MKYFTAINQRHLTVVKALVVYGMFLLPIAPPNHAYIKHNVNMVHVLSRVLPSAQQGRSQIHHQVSSNFTGACKSGHFFKEKSVFNSSYHKIII